MRRIIETRKLYKETLLKVTKTEELNKIIDFALLLFF